jgi:hypothetical protein
MQAQAAIPRVPLTTLRVIVQRFIEFPSLPAIFGDEQGCGLSTGIQHIRFIGAARLDVPDLDHLLCFIFDLLAFGRKASTVWRRRP